MVHKWLFRSKQEDGNSKPPKTSLLRTNNKYFWRVKRGLQSSLAPDSLFLHSSSHWAPSSPSHRRLQITCKCNLCSQVGHINCPPTSQDICMWRLHGCTSEKVEGGEMRGGDCWRGAGWDCEGAACTRKEIHIHQFVLGISQRSANRGVSISSSSAQVTHGAD